MLKGQKKIRFNDDTQTFFIPYEERKGIWMIYATDRAHFKQRIERTEKLIQPDCITDVIYTERNFKRHL
jgi:hypothetical protein